MKSKLGGLKCQQITSGLPSVRSLRLVGASEGVTSNKVLPTLVKQRK